ncbi:MAG: hypothetical protein EAX86_09000 [Candidatus Heimdallarchaeota archaeon]|nr:hypothetical protein [Candidatus Heimdallarchaeota archaeon]
MEFILGITLAIIQAQKNKITVSCPLCGESETISLDEVELELAREQHSLITKALSHSKAGHVLTLYIDGQGIVRRKYCFEIAENHFNVFPSSLPNNLSSLFQRMIQDSMKSD